MNDAKFYVDRLLWVFRRSGGEGSNQVRPFLELPAETQTRLLASAALRDSEIPVIACALCDEVWVMLTSERLISRNEHGLMVIAVEDIVDARVDGKALREAGSRGKLGIQELIVEARDGSRHRLGLEPGNGFIGFWNVLKSVAAPNRR